MTAPTDPATVAGKLTKAQRERVLRAIFREKDGAWWPEGWYVGGDKRIRRALCQKGIIRDYLRYSYPLTPLGLAVRSHLLSDAGEGDGR
jgi:hypothetical protein